MKSTPRISVLTPSIRPEFLHIAQRSLEEQTVQDFEWLVEIGLPTRGFTLPADWNKMLRRSQGELIVFYQDCITLRPDGLERMLKRHEENPKALITAPVGKKHGKEIKWDWRVYGTFEQPMTYNHWEIDWGAASRQAFFDVGGFDEDFCNGWSWENVEIAARMVAAGYTVHCDPYNYAYAVDHDALEPHVFRNKLPNNDHRANETARKARHGEFKLAYL